MSAPISLSPLLSRLEAESLYILREVAAAFRKPVLLYSAGKDSSVLLHLARKAFFPAALPFPLLHIDTTWKFKEMIALRDRVARAYDLDMRVYINEKGLKEGLSPFACDASVYTAVMKTEALKQALDLYGFDAAIGGARRDEEPSRSKERVFSVRRPGHLWDPRAQRPEFGTIVNAGLASGETMRVFPLSNWREIDVWDYIAAEGIEVAPLYFAQEREVVRRAGLWLARDDDRFELRAGDTIEKLSVRFRTLGCYPLTAAMPSRARTLEGLLQELRVCTCSERQGRMIDFCEPYAMERKKREGYF